MRLDFTTLFVDVGGVLLTNGWDREARKRAARHFGLDHEAMDERHHLTFDTYEVGKLSLDGYLERVVFHRDRPFTPSEFRAFMFAQSKAFPEMIALVKRIRDRHRLKVVVVSNEGRELNEHRVRAFGLGSFVDCFVSSSYVHFRKPDEDIYRIALDIAQAAPFQVAYIDDRPLFVEVAASLGIAGIVHKDVETTRLALKDMGLDDQ
ncbi:HAD family hydrolase [Fundidesulfovibrio terrae]|uniref:HAD family hydrolase n=1 Tax=Fundidesulfovibrio terrae TaxID=2922866 RepID=UPI001FAFF137|nr:HAD family hydrolase [Fundidesulfovibrio terrae]